MDISWSDFMFDFNLNSVFADLALDLVVKNKTKKYRSVKF